MAELHFPLHGPSVNVVRRCGPALSEILQSKFECVAIIEGVDFEEDLPAQQKRPTIVQEKRFEAKLPSGLKISVWRADLTAFRAEAVVNAANVNLQHCGGLAAALSHAGGSQIKRESEDYIKRHGPLQTGEAIVTNAGLLPYNKIIHAVGPELQTQPSGPEVSQAKPLLRKAIRSILDRVKENHLKTVAIPAISSGLFHFPLPLCADVIVSTVKEYYDGPSFGRHRPEEIFLVNNDEPSVREMERACHQTLASRKPMMYSQAAAGKTSGPTVQMGEVRVTLKWGHIEEQQTDVIVNTASLDRDLKNGQISSALLKKAGYGIQKEIREAKPKGKIIVTKGYSLPCKEVFHTFCTEKGHMEAQKILFESVLECLWTAATNKHKSIAFPAIGTGLLKFTKKEAAQIMSHAVADFAQKYPTMMEVHFVIFPHDNDTFQAFEEEMRILKQKASHPSFTEALGHKEELRERKPPTPQISLRGPSDEASREAERWLSGLLKSSGTVTIRNNFILHFGKKEFAQLSRLTKDVCIDESFKNGHAEITVSGDYEDVVVAGLQVEALLCNTQGEFVKEEEDAMFMMSMENVSFERKTVDSQSSKFSNRFSELQKKGLWMSKLETVQNPTLETLFNLKKKQLQDPNSRRMFQRIPAQFCGMVGRIGFQREYAPPTDPAYGEGIYFSTLQKAMEVWKEQNEEYLYLVEAEVLTGNSTSGKPGLILPPAVGTDPKIMYDSVSGGPDISVIFSSYQALPRYIITCRVIQ
ncbi:protein mono-ADP-ribosyltransferase PARP9 [Trachinotus anak]|uniref:protein mono-ADP-ribosyltransferase PARP9 n=1 Tax=Trachinotus anak TaxID=443729 RepID=UPI0039F20E31